MLGTGAHGGGSSVGAEGQPASATKEQVDRVREMIETSQSGAQMDPEILNIILEEAAGYFEGHKSPEDADRMVCP